MYKLVAQKLSKRFGARKVFSNIDFELVTGESLAITGHNGSGKSTLMAVLLAMLRPTRGKVTFYEGEEVLSEDKIRASISLVAPYLNLYDQLSAEENLKFFATVSGVHLTGKEINDLLEQVGLKGRGHDLAGEYSSGMKQRLKYAVALLNEPAFLFLDEPTSNLDDAGKKIVVDLIEARRRDTVILIATNEKEEYGLARQECRLV